MPRRKSQIDPIFLSDWRPLPKLSSVDRRAISEATVFSISDDEWENLEQLRNDFAWSVWAQQNGIETKIFFERLRQIRNASKDLLRGLLGRENADDQGAYTVDKLSVVLWYKLAKNGSLPTQSECIGLLQELNSRAVRASNDILCSSRATQWAQNWTQFINILADLFESHGLRVTAAKGLNETNPKFSPFVNFIWAIMRTLPSDRRKYSQSKGSLTKAISDALKTRRAHRLPRDYSTKLRGK